MDCKVWKGQEFCQNQIERRDTKKCVSSSQWVVLRVYVSISYKFITNYDRSHSQSFLSNLCENIHLMWTNFAKIIVQFVKFPSQSGVFAEEREERNQNE